MSKSNEKEQNATTTTTTTVAEKPKVAKSKAKKVSKPYDPIADGRKTAAVNVRKERTENQATGE